MWEALAQNPSSLSEATELWQAALPNPQQSQWRQVRAEWDPSTQAYTKSLAWKCNCKDHLPLELGIHSSDKVQHQKSYTKLNYPRWAPHRQQTFRVPSAPWNPGTGTISFHIHITVPEVTGCSFLVESNSDNKSAAIQRQIAGLDPWESHWGLRVLNLLLICIIHSDGAEGFRDSRAGPCPQHHVLLPWERGLGQPGAPRLLLSPKIMMSPVHRALCTCRGGGWIGPIKRSPSFSSQWAED